MARLIFVSNAIAQEPTPPPSEAEAGRVIVTGSNIPTAQEEASLPVTKYSADWLTKSGANAPVEGLRQLPSFVGNAATENDSNGGTGAATVNLRALGSENVLIVINGRRAFLGSGFRGVDVNLIPLSGLQRVEVLKDGASSIYGSDAVAGVVNFIMWNDTHDDGPLFEGAEFEIRYGNTTDTDANVRQAWIRGGVTGLDGKVAIFASAEYYDRAGIYSRDRYISMTGDTSNNQEINVNPDRGIAGLGLGGFNTNSPTFAGRVSVSPPTETFPQTFLVGQLVLSDLTTNQVSPASYRPFDVVPGTDPARFNFRAFSPAIPAIEKSMEYISGRYRVFGDALQVYGDMMYSHYRQDNGLAGAPFTINIFTNGLPEARGSIFNPFGDRLREVSYRLQQTLGNRLDSFDKDCWRWVVGAKGDVNFTGNAFISRLGYDAGITYERFEATETDAGDAVRSKIVEQIALGRFNPFIGQNAPVIGVAPTYRTIQIGTTPEGEPIFERVPTGETAPYNNVLATQLASYLGHSLYHQKDFVYDVTVNARLFPNLWNGGIDVAGGYQHIWEQQHSTPDPIQVQGDQLGFNAEPNFKYRQEVNAWFGEVRIPLVISTMSIPLINSFEVDYAYRYEEFDDTDLTNPGPHQSASFDNGGNNRVTIRYQLIPDLLLRGTWGQSFLSPALGDLFTPVFQDFPELFDPVTRSIFQVGVLFGGNKNLKPEKTETWTAGLVYSPKFVPGFTLTADWYQGFTQNLIVSGENYAQLLLVADPFNPAIHRDPFTNEVVFIESLNNNAGKRFIQGLDVTAVYQLPTTNFGQFAFTLGWNHFFTWKAEPVAGLGTHDFMGNYNSGSLPLAPGAIPFNKGFVRVEWQYNLGPGNLDFVAQGNYIGDFEDDPGFILGNDVVAQNPGTLLEPNWMLHRRVTDYMTLDLQASYEFVRPAVEPRVPGYARAGKDTKSLSSDLVAGTMQSGALWQRMFGGTKITAGVINAFDRNPPTVLGAFNDNYDTSLYSIRNRFYYIALSKKF